MTGESDELDGTDWSPNNVKESRGDYECNYKSCRADADWDVELVNRHGQMGLIRACDEHIEKYWGYHPEEQ